MIQATTGLLPGTKAARLGESVARDKKSALVERSGQMSQGGAETGGEEKGSGDERPGGSRSDAVRGGLGDGVIENGIYGRGVEGQKLPEGTKFKQES